MAVQTWKILMHLELSSLSKILGRGIERKADKLGPVHESALTCVQCNAAASHCCRSCLLLGMPLEVWQKMASQRSGIGHQVVVHQLQSRHLMVGQARFAISCQRACMQAAGGGSRPGGDAPRDHEEDSFWPCCVSHLSLRLTFMRSLNPMAVKPTSRHTMRPMLANTVSGSSSGSTAMRLHGSGRG